MTVWWPALNFDKPQISDQIHAMCMHACRSRYLIIATQFEFRIMPPGPPVQAQYHWQHLGADVQINITPKSYHIMRIHAHAQSDAN